MNSKLNRKAWLAGRFIDFMLHSGNRYQVHSPFLYSLIGEVIRKDKPVFGGDKIESLRKECLKSEEIILKTDYGIGSPGGHGITYPVSLKRIARTSLTSPRHARRLSRLSQYLGSKNILELGTSLGMTTAYLALSNPDARVITLEGCPELSRKAREHFGRLGIKNIELVEGRFEDTLPAALEMLGTVDLLYIDGNHRKEALLGYYRQYSFHSVNDTVIVLDDIHSTEEMEQAWDQIRQSQEIRLCLDFFLEGWIFFRKESTREHFRLRYI